MMVCMVSFCDREMIGAVAAVSNPRTTADMDAAPTKRFSNRVENYVKYRPDYPREILSLLNDHIRFHKSWTIADVGSGTGISARMFLENGNEVFGVEPNADMRAAGEV